MSSERKHPPHSIEPEQNILGGLMQDNRMFWEVADVVTADDFYRRDHQEIFTGISEMIRKNKPCDFMTLTEHFRDNGKLVDIGGMAYIGTLALECNYVSQIVHHAKIVREKSMRRGLIAAGTAIVDMGYNPEGEDFEVVLSRSEQLVLAVRDRGDAGAELPQDIETVGAEWLANLDAMQNGTAVPGLMTGLVELDQMTGGFHPGNLVIIGGETSKGKSTLAVNICDFLAERGDTGAVFSMEMTRQELYSRLVAARARVRLDDMRTKGALETSSSDRISRATADIRGIVIDDRSGLTADQICATSRRLHRKKRLKYVVIDYLQLVVGTNGENRPRELEYASRQFKNLGKELGIPVICPAQLNRGPSSRPDPRPRISDIRDCAGIGHDADLVLLIHRDDSDDSRHKGTAEVIIAKQRNGPIGSVRLAWLAEYCVFENLAPGYVTSDPAPHQQTKQRGFSRSALIPFNERATS